MRKNFNFLSIMTNNSYSSPMVDTKNTVYYQRNTHLLRIDWNKNFAHGVPLSTRIKLLYPLQCVLFINRNASNKIMQSLFNG